eukprot:CAMPEP_0114236130 /NCGR_PEP_ID=MMETSP0058-20121206/6658_1 /TAXON_ID=36894 /ORGANISM="Pyramimonas parkeae, CCMP726" /LENGTH=288 /DNA_ID=CAMNT_0001348015 /DNA_START=514 /DNA_END=1382 /DNA_ORIENTATION=+
MRVSGGFESGVNQQFLVLSIVPLRQSNLPWVGVLKFSTQGLQRESNSQTQDPELYTFLPELVWDATRTGKCPRGRRRRAQNSAPPPIFFPLRSAGAEGVTLGGDLPLMHRGVRATCSSTRLGAERVFLSPEHSKNDYGKSSPGPSVYNPKASVGQQAESHKENAPSFVFSSAERFKYEHVERAARMPGAGQYNAINSVGKQPDSKKSTLPRYSFGSSKREHRAKVYISAEHEKCSHGMASPGPALVGGKSSVGKQQSSRNVSSSSWSFGSARRFVYSESKVPGPGTYD